jgi:hypothetical protein
MVINVDELVRDVVRMIHSRQAGANVADLVWLGPAALSELDAHARDLSQAAPTDRLPAFEHGAYVLAGGWLLIAVVTNRGGFCFRIEPGGWGWSNRPS